MGIWGGTRHPQARLPTFPIPSPTLMVYVRVLRFGPRAEGSGLGCSVRVIASELGCMVGGFGFGVVAWGLRLGFRVDVGGVGNAQRAIMRVSACLSVYLSIYLSIYGSIDLSL